MSETQFHDVFARGFEDFHYKDESMYSPTRHSTLVSKGQGAADHLPDPTNVRSMLGIHLYLLSYGEKDFGIGFPGQYRFLTSHLQAHGEFLRNPSYFQRFIELAGQTFDVLRCPLGWGDDFDHLLKFKRKDERRHSFALNFYGRDAVAKIGRDRLLSAPAWKVDERPWGGIIVQLVAEPFNVNRPIPDEKREALRKHLRLEEIQWE